MESDIKEIHCSSSTDDLQPVIKRLLRYVADDIHILLYGDLGSGKTTLISKLMSEISDNEVSSPTYSIVNEYMLHDSSVVYHMDLYRIDSTEELLDIGFEDYLQRGVCIIEWPHLALSQIDGNAVHIHIKSHQNRRKYYEFLTPPNIN